MTRQMTSRFASKCLNCPVKIQADEQINYTPGVGSSHVVCPDQLKGENILAHRKWNAQDRNDLAVFESEGRSRGIVADPFADPDADMYLSEAEMDRDDAAYMAWIQFQASQPMRVAVEDSGVYVMPDGSIVKVQANREKTRTYAKRWTVIPGIRLTEAGSKEHGEYVYEPSLVQEVARSGRKMSLEEAKAFILRYGQCARCSRQLKDANSVERGLGPICVKYFSTGTTAADLMVAA